MTVCLLLIGDGREDYHERSYASLMDAIDRRVIDDVVPVDDSEHRLGFCGAIQAGWDRALQLGADYIVHVELDFIFNAPVPLDRMIAVLERHPELAQLVLKRQPWNEQEHEAGGIVEQHPDDYLDRQDDGGDVWTEHRRFWSTNPCLYSTHWCRLGWPQEPRSEGVFTHRLLADPLLRFAFWGAKTAAPLVEHIGDERLGKGY